MSKEDKYQEIVHKMHSCDKCRGLVINRSKVVHGRGDLNADLMIVGEAQGAREDMVRYPFCGDAGEMLHKALAKLMEEQKHAIIERKVSNNGKIYEHPGIYITNIVKCRPPNNRAPEKEECERCIKHLYEEIKLIRPKVVLTLGNTATKAILPGNRDDFRITRDRNKVHYLTGRDNGEKFTYRVIPEVHPSFILRQKGDNQVGWKWRLWESLRKAAHLSGIRHDDEFEELEVQRLNNF